MTKEPKTSKIALSPEATELAERLRVWRETLPAGQRIPEELWKAAGKLAREHGVSLISTVLRLHYYDLRKHAFPENGSPPPRQAAFVELARPVIAPSPESWTLELQQA